MHLPRKRKSGARAVIDGITEAARRSDLPERAADVATRIATQVAHTSADVGSQAGERVSEVAHAVSEEGRSRLEQRRKDRTSENKSRRTRKVRKRRVRRALALAGAGAVTAYFLDPDNGRERRVTARRRTSRSAQVVGDGLDAAAHVAHQAAEVTDPGSAVNAEHLQPTTTVR